MNKNNQLANSPFNYITYYRATNLSPSNLRFISEQSQYRYNLIGDEIKNPSFRTRYEYDTAGLPHYNLLSSSISEQNLVAIKYQNGDIVIQHAFIYSNSKQKINTSRYQARVIVIKGQKTLLNTIINPSTLRVDGNSEIFNMIVQKLRNYQKVTYDEIKYLLINFDSEKRLYESLLIKAWEAEYNNQKVMER